MLFTSYICEIINMVLIPSISGVLIIILNEQIASQATSFLVFLHVLCQIVYQMYRSYLVMT